VSTEEVLSKAPLFSALDRESAAALRTSVTEVELPKGRTLFSENETGDRLYVVLEGKIKLARTAPDGRENLLSVLVRRPPSR
jgi:CRP/FNR family cyclic AMP-dependent transcriptional regulator